MIVVIHARFSGPPGSGHGGYVAGLVAGLSEGPTRVRLVRRPPLERPLVLRAGADRTAELLDGDVVVARGAATEPIAEKPAAVAFEEAVDAARAYPGFRDHAFPRCFACGPDRAPGDGLRIFPGPVAGRDLVAAPWVPDASLVDGVGLVRPEFLWAALDCPGGWAALVAGARAPVLLGELTAQVAGSVREGERCVVVGWSAGVDGRKRQAGSAVFGADGTLRAVARATWIELAEA